MLLLRVGFVLWTSTCLLFNEFADSVVIKRNFATLHNTSMLGYSSTIVPKMAFHSMVSCAYFCNNVADCTAFTDEELTCTLMTTPMAIYRNIGSTTLASEDLLTKLGYKKYKFNKYYKVVTGTFSFDTCRTKCKETVDFGTLFCVESREDYQWLEINGTAMTSPGRIFIGLYSDTNLTLSWEDGTAYQGSYNWTYNLQLKDSMGCIAQPGTQQLNFYLSATAYCSCMCQALTNFS